MILQLILRVEEMLAPSAAGGEAILLVRDISTRYRHRGDSVAPIVQLIGRHYRSLPGNYLAFFSSFDYLQQVASRFAQCHQEALRQRQQLYDRPHPDVAHSHVLIGNEHYMISWDGLLMPAKKDQAPPDLRYFSKP